MNSKSLWIAILSGFLFLACGGTEQQGEMTQEGETEQYGQYGAQQEGEQQWQTASGEILRVDTDGKTLALRDASGEEMTFSYDEQTRITGSETTVEGLATQTGSQVQIRYEEGILQNRAVEIDVLGAGLGEQPGMQQPGQSPQEQPQEQPQAQPQEQKQQQ